MRGFLLVVGMLAAGCTSPNPNFRADGLGGRDGAVDNSDGLPCKPHCYLRECGDDGCGGSCGECPVPLTCNAKGRCVQGCTPNCHDKQCGPDGCGGSCGQCTAPLTCSDSGRCVPSCTPDCHEKQCGDDGCGGSCGTCNFPEVCVESTGQCASGSGCGGVSYEGCCNGNVLKFCDNGKLRTQDCANHPSCGWDFNNKYYNCNTAGLADPSGQHPMSCP